MGREKPLAIAHARRSDETGRRNLEYQIDEEEGRLRTVILDIEKRKRTSDLAKKLLKRLEKAELQVVCQRLKDIGPLLDRIYARMDPQPPAGR